MLRCVLKMCLDDNKNNRRTPEIKARSVYFHWITGKKPDSTGIFRREDADSLSALFIKLLSLLRRLSAKSRFIFLGKVGITREAGLLGNGGNRQLGFPQELVT